MTYLQELLRTPLSWIGMPPEVLPMAIVRPLTGSGSLAVLADMTKQYGTDSIYTKMAATIYGSTETTFYVIAVYFGAVNIRKTRHALTAGIIADVSSILLSCWVIRMFFHH
jgi:spore maturation protein B